MPKPQRPVHEINRGRFDRRVTKVDGCWIWTGVVANHKGRKPYPVMPFMDFGTRKETTYSARRYAWEEFKGILEKGDGESWKEIVLNTCGNDTCVSPEHSEVSTKRDRFVENVRTSGNRWNKKHTKTEEELLSETSVEEPVHRKARNLLTVEKPTPYTPIYEGGILDQFKNLRKVDDRYLLEICGKTVHLTFNQLWTYAFLMMKAFKETGMILPKVGQETWINKIRKLTEEPNGQV